MNKRKQHKKLLKLNAKAWDCPDRRTAQKLLEKFDKIEQKLQRRG